MATAEAAAGAAVDAVLDRRSARRCDMDAIDAVDVMRLRLSAPAAPAPALMLALLSLRAGPARPMC